MAVPKRVWLALPLVLMREAASGVGRVASSWPAPKRGTDGLHRASWTPGLSGPPKTSREGEAPQDQGGLVVVPGIQTPPHMASEFRVADPPGGEAQLEGTSPRLLCCSRPGPTGVVWKL